MEERKDKRPLAAIILCMLAGFALWVILICLKVAGAVSMKWITVLSGFVWLTWLAFAFAALVAALVYLIAKVKRWHRRRKTDARIIRQAKAAGVWNTNAGGRALELYAKECGVKKFAGESDAHLRQRIKAGTEKRPKTGR